ncbi:MAG: hypothetical protein Q7U27_14955 [Pseudomonas sp.]|uniref:hypothetical protein n=1 Tax=unclassified Pseudomonas TaxID=196821 RepID=UPI00098BB006|nr:MULTISPECIES: hypothetical protein [unclassified Pseudomonas]MDF9881610.1 hypothetical protein [Pseudomonas silensiensis]MDO9330017.1 hypothetical protein [Pseudomonas sp.]OOL34795.1 hypothetical protein BOO94_26530 [Pseudomonas sp. FSL W5-0299]
MTKGLSSDNLHYALGAIKEDPSVDLSVICVHLQTDSRDLLNQLAIFVARLFVTGTRDFHYCDEVMNIVFSDIVDLSLHAEMPEPAFSIYLAFDSGEYWHSGDQRDVFPWEKWTRPELERILCGINEGASGFSK